MKSIARIDEKEVFKSPIGMAYWPWILVPDVKYNKHGEYKIWMAFDGQHELQFHRQIQDLYDTAVEQKRIEKAVTTIDKADPPWTRSKDGKLLFFKFKLTASGIADGGRRWDNPPPKIFDSRARLIEPDPTRFKPGTGSLVRVHFRAKPYFVKKAGVSLRLAGVQIFKYVEYDPATSLGVEPAEDGYVFEPEPESDIEKRLREPEPKLEAPNGATDIPF